MWYDFFMAVKITYLTHGTTTDNENDIGTGWLPGELSDLGVQQAKELGVQVKDKHFDAFYTSDLKRAVISAELGFKNTYQIRQDDRLRECNYGDFNGKPEELFKPDFPKYIDSPMPNGESFKDVERRIQEFLNFLKQEYDGKQVAILAHQAPQLALEVLLKDKTWELAFKEDWRKRKAWKPGWEYVVV